jgi:serine/threonine-protein kinase
MDRDPRVGIADATAAGNTVAVRPSSVDPPVAASIRGSLLRYRLDDVIGVGGMGEVVSAYDDQIGRSVAIKRMRANDPTPEETARFLREARIQGRLDHPAVVPVHELQVDEQIEGRMVSFGL